MSIEAHKIILCPIVTEESQIQTSKGSQYTFKVNPKSNKKQIREAIEAIFSTVKVVSVNTMNYDGKIKRQLGVSRRAGRRSSWKKAIVTLRAGDSIDLI